MGRRRRNGHGQTTPTPERPPRWTRLLSPAATQVANPAAAIRAAGGAGRVGGSRDPGSVNQPPTRNARIPTTISRSRAASADAPSGRRTVGRAHRRAGAPVGGRAPGAPGGRSVPTPERSGRARRHNRSARPTSLLAANIRDAAAVWAKDERVGAATRERRSASESERRTTSRRERLRSGHGQQITRPPTSATIDIPALTSRDAGGRTRVGAATQERRGPITRTPYPLPPTECASTSPAAPQHRPGTSGPGPAT